MPPNALLVSKFKSSWEHFLVNKLSLCFDLDIFYLDDFHRASCVFSDSISYIKKLVVEKQITHLFLDVEFYPSVDVAFVKALDTPSVVVVMLFFDDLLMHDFNSITASSADVVLSADPISVLRFKEKGIPSYFFPLEGDKNCFSSSRATDKDIDVLFFGSILKADRAQWLSYLISNGISVISVGPGSDYVSFEELSDLMSRSKIILDLSKSSLMSSKSIHDNSRPYRSFFSYYYQLKGRVIMAGLSGTCCVSEYSPALRLLFGEHEVPAFTTLSECLLLLKDLLSNPSKIYALASNLSDKVHSEYEDSVVMSKLHPVLVKKVRPLVLANSPPLWYKCKVFLSRVKILLFSLKCSIRSLLTFSA